MKAADIDKVALVGAGTMGAGFALCFGLAGIAATLYDPSQVQLDKGRERIANALQLFLAEGLTDSRSAGRAIELIDATTDLKEALAGAKFVLEAAPEDLTLKQELFIQIEGMVGSDTVLATNTSALPISEVAAKCARPQMVCGMHWFNPPELVPLVEVIPGEKTDPQVAQLVYDLAGILKHAPIMVKKEAPGFVGNRMQLALVREALNILEQGLASPEDVDKAVKYGLGFRWSFMGPLLTIDYGGLDTWGRVASYLFPRLSNAADAPKAIVDREAQGKLGVKSGEGFFSYQGDEALEAVKRRDLYFLRQLRLLKESGGL